MTSSSPCNEVIIRQFQPQDQQRCIELFTIGLCSYKTPPHYVINPWFVEEKLKTDMGNIQQYYINKHQHNFWVAELNGIVWDVSVLGQILIMQSNH